MDCRRKLPKTTQEAPHSSCQLQRQGYQTLEIRQTFQSHQNHQDGISTKESRSFGAPKSIEIFEHLRNADTIDERRDLEREAQSPGGSFCTGATRSSKHTRATRSIKPLNYVRVTNVMMGITPEMTLGWRPSAGLPGRRRSCQSYQTFQTHRIDHTCRILNNCGGPSSSRKCRLLSQRMVDRRGLKGQGCPQGLEVQKSTRMPHLLDRSDYAIQPSPLNTPYS